MDFTDQQRVLAGGSGPGLAILNVSQIKTPELSGNPRNVVALAIDTVAVSAIYGWILV